MPDTKTLTEEQLKEIEALSARVPDGPWFADADIADDVPDHRCSGLALVDTGRSADWWIARLCEWHTARFIAESKTNIDALCRSLRAAWADIDRYKKVLSDRLREMEALTGSFDKLEAENEALRTQNQTQAESIIEFQANEKSLKAQLKEAEYKVRQCENAFELQDAVRIPEVGNLNMLQIVRKLGELQTQLAQVEQEKR